MNTNRILCPDCGSPWYVKEENTDKHFCTSCGTIWNKEGKVYKVGNPLIG